MINRLVVDSSQHQPGRKTGFFSFGPIVNCCCCCCCRRHFVNQGVGHATSGKIRQNTTKTSFLHQLGILDYLLLCKPLESINLMDGKRRITFSPFIITAPNIVYFPLIPSKVVELSSSSYLLSHHLSKFSLFFPFVPISHTVYVD